MIFAKTSIFHGAFAALLGLALAGCSLTPTYERPQPPVPAQWSAADAAEAAEVSADWWQRFGSSELDALMARALAGNYDLVAALARIDRARATARSAGAALSPSLDVSGSAGRNYRREDGGSGNSSSDQLLLSADYELDLWGGNRAQLDAARAAVTASRYDHDALALVLQSEVASSYFQILSLRERLVIAEDNLQTSRRVLELVEARYRLGAGSGLELAQQRNAVASQEAQLPALRQQYEAAENAMAVLTGIPPQGFTVAADTLAPIALPRIAAGQPSSLLERRPDIRSVEASLIAANADIGAARAAFYPSVRLSASGGVAGFISGGSATVGSIAASLLAPIFDGGRLQGNLEASRARQRELAAGYSQTVLTAFQDVEDALVAVRASERRATALVEAARQAEIALELAQVRYRSGAEDLLTVLDAQRSQLQAQDGLVQARLARYTAAVSLYKALGGGWES